MLSVFKKKQTATLAPPPKAQTQILEEARARVKDADERLQAADKEIMAFAHAHSLAFNQFGGPVPVFPGAIIHWTAALDNEFKLLNQEVAEAQREFHAALAAHASLT